MVGILVFFWDGLFPGAILVSGKVLSLHKSFCLGIWGTRKDSHDAIRMKSVDAEQAKMTCHRNMTNKQLMMYGFTSWWFQFDLLFLHRNDVSFDLQFYFFRISDSRIYCSNYHVFS